MALNVVSSRVRPSLSCMTKIILNFLGWRRSVWTTVGADLITRQISRGIRITWCSRRNSISSTISKSSIPTTTKSTRLLHPPNYITVCFTSPTTGKAIEFTTFIFSVSFLQWRFSHLASATILKLWVAPESTTMLFACSGLTQVSTYVRPHFARLLVSPTFFWSDDKNLMTPTLGFSTSSAWSTFLSDWRNLPSESEAKEAWKAYKTDLFEHSLAWCALLHM